MPCSLCDALNSILRKLEQKDHLDPTVQDYSRQNIESLAQTNENIVKSAISSRPACAIKSLSKLEPYLVLKKKINSTPGPFLLCLFLNCFAPIL